MPQGQQTRASPDFSQSVTSNLDPIQVYPYNAGPLPQPLSQFDYRLRQARRAELVGNLVGRKAISWRANFLTIWLMMVFMDCSIIRSRTSS